jgi:hypothetical protein
MFLLLFMLFDNLVISFSFNPCPHSSSQRPNLKIYCHKTSSHVLLQVLSVFLLELLARTIALGWYFWTPVKDCRWNYFEVLRGVWVLLWQEPGFGVGVGLRVGEGASNDL